MSNMPEKDAGLWAAVAAFLSAHSPQISAFAMSVAVAVLRVVYGGGGRRQQLLEGSLCGLAAVAVVPLLEYLGLPSSMAIFAGCLVGFVGAKNIEGYADRILGRKADHL